MEISPATVAQALHIPEVFDHYIPDRAGIIYPSWDIIARELSGKRVLQWDGRRFQDSDLTPEYHMLHLALCNYILVTTFKKSFSGYHAKVLYAIGKGKRVCLARLFIDFLVHPTQSTSRKAYLKSAWAIHRVCEAAAIPSRPTNKPLKGLGPFGVQASHRSAG